jgi:hypothetical protein
MNFEKISRGKAGELHATRMKNIEHKKKMLAWMAGAAALFNMGGYAVWLGAWREAAVWFGFGGWALWEAVKKWKERAALEKSRTQSDD